jgi:hypothetical protein
VRQGGTAYDTLEVEIALVAREDGSRSLETTVHINGESPLRNPEESTSTRRGRPRLCKRFVADESVDAPIVHRLREAGHEVWSVAEESPSISDREVLRAASEADRVLLTADRDFGDLHVRLGLPSP